MSTPAGAADRHVVVEGPRVAREVLLGPELERVEEDRHDDVGMPLPRRVDEPCVSVVQGTHRHDDGDVPAGQPLAGRPAARAGSGRPWEWWVRRSRRGAPVWWLRRSRGLGWGFGPAGWPRVGEGREEGLGGARTEPAAVERPGRGGPGERDVGGPDLGREAAPVGAGARSPFPTSPRATGPVSAASPSRRALSSAAWTSGAEHGPGLARPRRRGGRPWPRRRG